MKRSVKICRNLLLLLVILTPLLSLRPAWGVQAMDAAGESVEPAENNEAIETFTVDTLEQLHMDFDLSDEILQASEVLSKLMPKERTEFYVYPNPREVAAPYIPKAALCTDVCIIGDVVSIDYRIGDVRYIAAYCKDGTVRMTSSLLSDEVQYVYEMSSDSPNTVSCLDCNKNTVVWEKETESRGDETP